MNSQEIFDKIVSHLRAQGEKSVKRDIDGQFMCAYRGDDGRKCAIGALIPDLMYESRMEGIDLDFLLIRFPKINLLFDNAFDVNNPSSLLKFFQRIHDGDPVAAWEEEFQRLAEKYKLKYTAPKKSINA